MKPDNSTQTAKGASASKSQDDQKSHERAATGQQAQEGSPPHEEVTSADGQS